jgi:hypothetical protein
VAKDKVKETGDPTPFVAPTVGVPPAAPTAAVDPKDAEIERLKAELEAAKSAASTTAPVSLDGPKRKFLVGVLNGPSWVVEAVHEALAANEYLKATGMISWTSPPQIRDVGDEVPLGEFKG